MWYLKEIRFNDEFEFNPIYLGEKLLGNLLNVYIPKSMYTDFIRMAIESYNEDFNKMVEDFIAKKIEYIHKNTKYRILVKDDEVVVKYNGIVKNRLKKETFVKAETAFVNSVANSDNVVQFENEEHGLPTINSDGRIELFAWLEGSQLKFNLKNHIAPDGRNFNTSTIRNFIQKDWMKGIISKRIVYFSTKDIYTIVKDKQGNEFAVKARRPDFSVTKDQIDAWNKVFAYNFDNGLSNTLFYFVGNVDGDNSHLFFGIVPSELRNMNKDQFIEYLAKEVENKLMTETDAKKNVKYAMEKFAAGNTQIFAQLAARHELFKEIKGKDYAIRYQKKGLAKFWKYFKLDNGKGIESPLLAKMMLVDHENLVVKYKGKEVPVHLPDGKYAWDGWQIVSPKWMHKVTTMLGKDSAVLKSVVRYHDGQGNYIAEKMGSFTAFPGMEFYRKTNKGLELVAKVEGNDRTARLVDAKGNEIDHIVTQEEAKDFAGDFKNFWEVKPLPRDAIRILFYPTESAKTSAHPVLAYELGLNAELEENPVYQRWLNAVEKFIGERVDENIENIVQIVSDPKKFAEFIIGDGAPTTELELAASINPKALYLPYLKNQWQKRFINRILDRINRLRPLEGNGTKLFFKPHVFMNLKKGEVAISGENRTLFKKIAAMYNKQTEKKVPYNSYGIDILNAWLEKNKVYVLIAKFLINDYTKVQLFKIKSLVCGYHGETIFFSYEDVFFTHGCNFNTNLAEVEFIPNYLQNTWLEWQNSPEYKNWYRDVYDIFKSKADKGLPADPYAQDEFVEMNNISRYSKGKIGNSKVVFHVLSWKETEVEFNDGKKAVMYKPFDKVVMDYWEIDEEKLNSKFRNGKTLKQMIKENGDKIVEIDGKEYLETQKTTEFSYILQMAVDELKFRLLKELGTDNLHLWMIQRMFKYSDGSKIENIKHLRALSKLYSLFNYSNITYGRTKRFNTKMNADEYVDTVEDVYDRFYNGDKLLSSEEISSKITQQLKRMTSSIFYPSPVVSVKMKNKLSARELISTQFVRARTHSKMFYSLMYEDKQIFHQTAYRALRKQFIEKSESLPIEIRKHVVDLVDKMSIELDKIDHERYSNPKNVDTAYHEYRISKKYENFMLKYADEFNSLTKDEKVFATMYWLHGAKRTEKGQRRVTVNRMMPIIFMDKDVFSAYADAYYEAMKSSDILDFEFNPAQKSALGKIVRVITPEIINYE